MAKWSKVCLGFPKLGAPQAYRKDENAKLVPAGFFGPLDAAVGKREESGRLAHHCHGLMMSRLLKLHNFTEVMNHGARAVLEWMESIASSVMDNMVACVNPDGTLARVRPEVTEGMVGETTNIPVVKELFRYELPNTTDENTMREFLVRFKQALLIHFHASRCTKGGCQGTDDSCALGFEPGPDVIAQSMWNDLTQELQLRRDRRKLVSSNDNATLSYKCNNNVMIIGDISARMAKKKGEKTTFAQGARLVCFYTVKYTGKIDDHTGDELIANLAAAASAKSRCGQGNSPDGEQWGPKMLITRCVNAMHRCGSPLVVSPARTLFLAYPFPYHTRVRPTKARCQFTTRYRRCLASGPTFPRA